MKNYCTRRMQIYDIVCFCGSDSEKDPSISKASRQEGPHARTQQGGGHAAVQPPLAPASRSWLSLAFVIQRKEGR